MVANPSCWLCRDHSTSELAIVFTRHFKVGLNERTIRTKTQK